MRKLMLAVLALTAVAGCSSEPPAPESAGFTMQVQLTISPQHTQRLERGCESKPIVRVPDRTPVLVRDGNGGTIGAGQLATGIVQQDGGCIMTAVVDVSAPSDFYEVTFGTREPVTMPADRVVNDRLSLQLGY